MLRKIASSVLVLFISSFCFAQSAAFDEGIKWKEKGNLVEALKHFEKAMEADASNKKARDEYANASFQLRQYAKALPTYEMILAQEPKNLTALVRLAKMYSFSSEKFKSVEYAERALELNPTDYDEQIALGDAFYFVKHYPKAVELYKKVQPANEYTTHKIAKSYEKMGNFNSAAHHFALLIEMKEEPKASLYYEYGNALFDNQNFKLATKAYLKSKELGFYNSKMINQNIAMGFYAIKAYEPALEFYLEAQKSAPYDKALNLEIADCYTKMAKFKEARAVITKMQETNPDDGELMYAYGMTYYKEGKVSKAEVYFGKAFVLKPALKSLRYTKSRF